MKKRVVVVVVIAALAAFAWWLRQHNRSRAAGEAVWYGNVDIREVNVGFRVFGRIKEVLRDEGDPVKANEVVARLDAEPYVREVEEARARKAAAAARLEMLQAGNRPQEIERARAQLRELEVSAENAERIYRRQEQLFAQKTISVQERDDAQARFSEAKARLASGQEQLKLLEAGFRTEEITQARADLSRAEAALALAELRLQDTDLKAPADGVVITRVQEPGAVVQAGGTVLTISLQRPVWVRAYLNEPELGRIHPGAAVEVFTDTRPDKAYAGTIGYISPRAEFTPKTVETPDLRTSLVYRFRVVVAEPDESLRQGMPVTVRLK